MTRTNTINNSGLFLDTIHNKNVLAGLCFHSVCSTGTFGNWSQNIFSQRSNKAMLFLQILHALGKKEGKKKKRTAKRKQSQTMFMKSIERIHFTSKDMSLQSARNINIPYFCRYIHTSFVKNSNIIRVKLIGFARLLTEAVKLHYVSKA